MAEITLTEAQQKLIAERRAMASKCETEWQMVCTVAIVEARMDPNGNWKLSDDGTKLTHEPIEHRQPLAAANAEN